MSALNRISLLCLAAMAFPTNHFIPAALADVNAADQQSCTVGTCEADQETLCAQETPTDNLESLTCLMCDDTCQICCTRADCDFPTSLLKPPSFFSSAVNTEDLMRFHISEGPNCQYECKPVQPLPFEFESARWDRMLVLDISDCICDVELAGYAKLSKAEPNQVAACKCETCLDDSCKCDDSQAANCTCDGPATGTCPACPSNTAKLTATMPTLISPKRHLSDQCATPATIPPTKATNMPSSTSNDMPIYPPSSEVTLAPPTDSIAPSLTQDPSNRSLAVATQSELLAKIEFLQATIMHQDNHYGKVIELMQENAKLRADNAHFETVCNMQELLMHSMTENHELATELQLTRAQMVGLGSNVTFAVGPGETEMPEAVKTNSKIPVPFARSSSLPTDDKSQSK